MSTSAKIDQSAADPSGAAPSKKEQLSKRAIFFASDGRQARFKFLQPVPFVVVVKGEPSPPGGDTGPG